MDLGVKAMLGRNNFKSHFAFMPLYAVIALNYLKLHVQSKIYVSEIQRFLLLKHLKCLV